MFSHMWNKLCGTSPRRRANRTTWGAIDGLESRELLAADLTLKNAFITLSELPNQPDKLWVNVQYTVYNAGTSGAELTGIPDNASDNVIVKVWASKNKTLDANDPLLAQNLNIFNDTGSHNLSQGAGVITAQAFAVTINPDYDYLICEVDANHVLPESSESNNRVAIDAFKPQVSNFWETKTINKLQNSMFGSSSSACDHDAVPIKGPIRPVGEGDDGLDFIESGRIGHTVTGRRYLVEPDGVGISARGDRVGGATVD